MIARMPIYTVNTESADLVPVTQAESDVWKARVVELLERALELTADDEEPMGVITEALAASYRMCGEAPEWVRLSASDLEPEDAPMRECICPPDLVARGGFKGGCPVHSARYS